MRLTVIGGSGGYPAEGKPCSGYLVEADGFILLIDPGYGVATALPAARQQRLDASIVSHGHPDHCADLNPILRARAWADPPLPPLQVYAPAGALQAVLALDSPLVLEGSYAVHDLQPGAGLDIGPFAVATALLPHPRPNLGLRISMDGRSLTYTGDCAPSEALVLLADATNVLLAEASYAEEVLPDVVGSLSSAADVGAQAAKAGVERLVLTHLMPRTDPDAAVAAAARHFNGPVSVAQPGLVLEV
jgi:ribonuclease BN (tRNA processing enzyme)